MATKIDIISGFLGAGKTTLIKKLLDEELQHEKVAIVENEFGQIGIDGKLFKGHNVKVEEINSGCICCTLQGDFNSALKNIIKEYQPERIIVEPSGVGKLSDIRQICLNPRFQCPTAINIVVAVVDATKFDMYLKNFGEFFRDQVEHAKTIVLSRTQSLPADRLESVVQKLHAINSSASIVTTPWQQISARSIISLAEGNRTLNRELSEMQAECEGHADNHNHEHQDGICHCHHHSADEVFESWGTETARHYSAEEISEILKELRTEKYGLVVRSKGILPSFSEDWIQFDFVSGEISIKPAAPDYSGRLCVIGKDINAQKLSELFKINKPS
jgi:G3E family GTPase